MAPQFTCPQIHQKKTEIVKHVARRDRLVEFDRIKQDRPVFDQHDVAQVEVAMTAADLTLIFALRKQRGEPRERLLHCVAKARDSLGREEPRRRFKRDEGLLNLALQCLASICAADDRRAPVRRGDNARQFGDDF